MEVKRETLIGGKHEFKVEVIKKDVGGLFALRKNTLWTEKTIQWVKGLVCKHLNYSSHCPCKAGCSHRHHNFFICNERRGADRGSLRSCGHIALCIQWRTGGSALTMFNKYFNAFGSNNKAFVVF